MSAPPRRARNLRGGLACLLLLLLGLATNLAPGLARARRAGDLTPLLGVGDSHWYGGPRAAYLDRALADGELPQWDPLSFCGQPFAANPQAAVFYPPNLVRSLVTPDPTPLRTHVGLAVLTALHVLLAGLGAWALARSQGIGHGGALVAAWGFAFSASFVRRIVANQFLGVVAWLPWILLALVRLQEAPAGRRRRRAGVAAALALACSVLGGFPQLGIYTVAGLVAWVLGRRLLSSVGAPGEGTSVPGGAGRAAVLDLLRLGVVGLVAALLAAPMLLPALQLIAASTRVDPALALPAGQGGSDYPGAWPLLRALAVYPGSAELDLNYRAAGACIAVLALAAVLHRERRRAAAVAILFLVFVDCSLGPPCPVSLALERLSGAPLVMPSRGFILACLPLALLAGFGVDALAAGHGGRAWRVLVLALGLGLCAAAWTQRAEPVFLGRSPAWLLPAVILVALGILASSGARVVATSPAGRIGAGLLALVLVGVETSGWNGAFVPYLLEQRGYRGPTARLGEPQRLPLDNRRSVVEEGSDVLYRMRPVINGYDPLHLSSVHRVVSARGREGKYDRLLSAEDVLARNARGTSLLERPFWLARQFVREVLPPKDRLFPATTTAFLQTAAELSVPEVAGAEVPTSSVARPVAAVALVPPAAPRWRPVGAGRRQLVLPRVEPGGVHSALLLEFHAAAPVDVDVTLVGPARSRPGPTLHLEPRAPGPVRAEIPLPDLRQVSVVLEVAAAREPPALAAARLVRDAADEGERIALLEWTANRVKLEVGPLEGPRVLSFLDADYPGWSATVDGQPTPIHLAAEAFKAVEVPAGTHVVEFRFRAERLGLGLGLCAAALAGCAAACAGRRRAR